MVFALVFLLVFSACQPLVLEESPITGRAITTTGVDQKNVTSLGVNIEVKPSDPLEPDPDVLLPQNQDYLIVPRNYISQFSKQNFELSIQDISYN